ncbi:MAG: Holliday junction branch migration protein RuvA [Rhodothermales bacterium]
MIAYVSGVLVSKKPTEVIVDVGGIGYRVLVPTSTFEQLPATGKKVHLTTFHHVREDAEMLYGFARESEYVVFGMMLAVSGVGPKLALAALSALPPNEIRERILEGDAALLTRIPGVGRKTAERMIVELRDRFEKVDPSDATSPGGGVATPASFRADALAALEALGLSGGAADKAVRSVLKKNPDLTSAEDIIRLALRE